MINKGRQFSIQNLEENDPSSQQQDFTALTDHENKMGLHPHRTEYNSSQPTQTTAIDDKQQPLVLA